MISEEEKLRLDAQYIHDFNSPGRRKVGYKSVDGSWNQLFVSSRKVDEILTQLDKNLNYFITLNAYSSNDFERNPQDVKYLNAFWLDLDIEKNGFEVETVLSQIDTICAETGLDEPSYIVNSGHGLYLIWRLETVMANSQQITRLWEKIEHTIADKFDEEFISWSDGEVGIVDFSALDPTRVLRVPGSYNLKYGQKRLCEVIGGNRKVYVLYDLADKILPYSYEDYLAKRRQNASDKHQHTKIDYHVKLSSFMKKNIWLRISDFQKLVELRHGDMVGIREVLLFLVANTVGQFTDLGQLNLTVDRFNNLYNEPLPTREVEGIKVEMESLSDKEDRDWYHYKNETIVELLDVTDEEAKQMTMLLTKNEKNRRQNIRTKKSNQKRTEARKWRSQEELRLINTMYTNGQTQQQIADELGVTRRTISNKLKKAKSVKKFTKM